MYFASFKDAMEMAGHGGYVWSAYLIAIVVIGCVLVLPRQREKRFFRELAGAERRRQREES